MNLENIRRARDLLTKILVAEGYDDPLTNKIIKAARRVVWTRYRRDDWHSLKDAIGELEDIVGCPPSEDEI